MVDVEEKLYQAMKLRKDGDLKTSNKLLLELVDKIPNDAMVNYQCAWSFDALGEEKKAVSYYEMAIKLGLSGDDLAGALLGLGSTYRTLGEYGKSKTTLLKGIELFPNHQAMKVFYAMVLYNLKEHDQAMEILLNSLIETSMDDTILNYKKAIKFYAEQLDRIWQ